jgi:hypothetical protein
MASLSLVIKDSTFLTGLLSKAAILRFAVSTKSVAIVTTEIEESASLNFRRRRSILKARWEALQVIE